MYVHVVCVALHMRSFPLLGGIDGDVVSGGGCHGGGGVLVAMVMLVLSVVVVQEVLLLCVRASSHPS